MVHNNNNNKQNLKENFLKPSRYTLLECKSFRIQIRTPRFTLITIWCLAVPEAAWQSERSLLFLGRPACIWIPATPLALGLGPNLGCLLCPVGMVMSALGAVGTSDKNPRRKHWAAFQRTREAPRMWTPCPSSSPRRKALSSRKNMVEISLDLIFFFLHKFNTLIAYNQKTVFKETAQVTFIIFSTVSKILPWVAV